MKPKVALLRGLARESGHWDPDFISDMQKHFELILLDYPGCGPFIHEDFPSTHEELLESLNKQLETKEKVFLVAVSLGGMVALKWVEKYPEKFSGLVLVNSSVADLNPFYQRLKPSAIFTFLGLSTKYGSDLAEKQIVELISNNPSKHANTIQRWSELAQTRPIKISNAWKQLKMAATFRSPPVPLKVPLQVLAGEKDRLASSECSRRIAAKYQAPLMLHATGGHDLMIDEPSWVSQQIQEFIKRRTTA